MDANVLFAIPALPAVRRTSGMVSVGHGQQVFHDPSGRRGRRVRGGLALALLLVIAAVLLLVGAVVATPAAAPLPMPQDALRPRALPVRLPPAHGSAKAWLPPVAQGGPGRPNVVGFYMPWDDHARRSLRANIGRMGWIVPGLASVAGAGHRFTYEADPHLRQIMAAAGATRPKILPMVQNATESGDWDGAGTAAMLRDRGARARFLAKVAAMLEAEAAAGVVFDLENLPADIHPAYLRFLAEARARFAPKGWLVTLAVPIGDPAWNLADYGAAADRLFLMAYDEHWPGGEPGPIASQPWFVRTVAAAVAAAGRDKAIVAIGNYAYDWKEGGAADILTVHEAWGRARAARTVPVFDSGTGNATFAYRQDGRRHDVWMLDAASAWNQVRAATAIAPAGVAIWRIGSEDPGLWHAIDTMATGTPAMASIPDVDDVTLAGTGEILRVDGGAVDGTRQVRTAADGLIHAERYDSLPSPFLIERTGNHRRQVVLTFDDGPDPHWTPRILDVLKAHHVPATFFVTGANAIGNPALLRRILAEGSEIGNHSTTHPDLGGVPDSIIRLELNATQRLVEAYTGRSMRLFRAPYLGDAEPTTIDALQPALIAAQQGYLTVGLHVDPLDWKAPGVDAIVAMAVEQVERGSSERPAQVILLHDAGGDRTQTIAALPRIIRALRARGYAFVTASTLAGLTPEQAMPSVSGHALATAHANRTLFHGLAAGRRGLELLFVTAITFGMLRSIALTVLALWSRSRLRVPAADPHRVPRFVSVLIPAWNEARVIEASVHRILATRDMRVEIVVINDGSTDGTSDIVRGTFGMDPRVRLLTLPNGGKARALNEGLRIARGDIVVALDADTQFEPETIARLARWFADPAIGAVAGNAKIGNAVNLITRWQAIEYVTAQNLERRALAVLDAITVVPGAVGAWRRAALDAVGGYPVDTLAEDQDLTIAVQRAGWKVACDIDAVAWTEAPETVRGLMRQRFRWAFGTLQSLWKHRAILMTGRPHGLARIGLPQAWLFQVGFAMVSPVIDLMLAASIGGTAFRIANHGWHQIEGDVIRMALFWAAFTAVDLACGWIAYRLDPRETGFPALRLLMQRFGYRQMMYLVVLRAVFAALAGPRIGWGKLERSGRVAAPSGGSIAIDAVAVPLREAA